MPIVEYLWEENLLQETSYDVFQVQASLAEVRSKLSSINKSVQHQMSTFERQLLEVKKLDIKSLKVGSFKFI